MRLGPVVEDVRATLWMGPTLFQEILGLALFSSSFFFLTPKQQVLFWISKLFSLIWPTIVLILEFLLIHDGWRKWRGWWWWWPWRDEGKWFHVFFLSIDVVCAWVIWLIDCRLPISRLLFLFYLAMIAMKNFDATTHHLFITVLVSVMAITRWRHELRRRRRLFWKLQKSWTLVNRNSLSLTCTKLFLFFLSLSMPGWPGVSTTRADYIWPWKRAIFSWLTVLERNFNGSLCVVCFR